MEIDIILVGAGIVGLAIARELQLKRPDLKIKVLEKESECGLHQTGHNSGVIHSGIYYKPGSLKAINCTRGYSLLLEYCKAKQIPFELCGKLIVATQQHELELLETIRQRGVTNGLTNLRYLTAEEIVEAEPQIRGLKAIHVPQTGIVDFKQVAQSYASDFQKAGGTLHFGEAVKNIEPTAGAIVVQTSKSEYKAKHLVNCAGLNSDRIARLTNGNLNLRIVPFRGEYYFLKPEKRGVIKNLIYPVPDPNFPFLGVHFTRTIHGDVEAGPNAVLALKREGYSKTAFNLVDCIDTLTWPGFYKIVGKYWRTGLGEFHRSLSKKAFTKALQRLAPGLNEDDLMPAEPGVRAQACDREGRLIDDFFILDEERMTHVCNAPSPAATSSLSIGQTVGERVLQRI